VIPCPKLDRHDEEYVEHIRHLCDMQEVSCFFCGITDHSLVGHHLRGKRRFGDIENIIVLEHRCHARIHQNGVSAITARYGVTVEQMQSEARRLYQLYLEMKA